MYLGWSHCTWGVGSRVSLIMFRSIVMKAVNDYNIIKLMVKYINSGTLCIVKYVYKWSLKFQKWPSLLSKKQVKIEMCEFYPKKLKVGT